MTEIFVDIIGYEGLYQISNMGRVKSLEKRVTAGGGFCIRQERNLKPSVSKDGYYSVRLYKEKVSMDFKVHRLVAKAFIPNTENKPQVNHLSGNKEDNSISNIEWATASENVVHSFKMGFSKPRIGVLNGVAKLNDEKVIAIRLKYKQGGIAIRKIAKEYSVDYALIQRIIKGKSWSHINI